MSRTTKDLENKVRKAVAAVYRRKPDVTQRHNRMPREPPGSWRNGLEQTAVSGLQPPRFTPGDPSPFLKKFQALDGLSGKWIPTDAWMSNVAKVCGDFLKEVVRLKDTLVTSLWSNCGKCFSAPTVQVAALQENPCCLFRACNHVTRHATRHRPILNVLPTDTKITPLARGKTTLVETDKGIQIRLNTKGYKKENITVEVEGNWLVIEALSTATEESGGYLQRHMMRRYELPPQADLQNILVELDERQHQLRVTVPTVKPKVTFT